MPSNVMFYDPRTQLLDNNAKPLFRGKMEFYEVGSVIPKSVYADKELTVSLGNEIHLDIAGRIPTSGLFLGVGDYSYSVFEDITPESVTPTWMESYNVPTVIGAVQSTIGINNAIFLNAVIDLPSVDFNESTVATCLGYYSAFDGGGGLFKWSHASTAPDDLGSIIASALSTTGRWIRIFDENIVTTAQYGVIGGQNTNMITRIQNCATYSNGSGFRMIFTQGNIQCDGFFEVNAQNVTIAENFKLVRLNALSSTDMVLRSNSIEVLGISHITQLGSTTIRLLPIQPLAIQPQWFGAVGNGISDDFVALEQALQSGSSLLLDGQFKISGSGDLNIHDVEFKAGAKLIHNSSGVVTVDGFVSSTLGYDSVFVKGSPTNRYNMIKDVNAEWFISHTPTEFEMRFLVDSATSQGTRIANVIWSQVGTYQLPFCNDYDPFTLVNHIIQPQSVWQMTGNTFQIGNGEVTPNMFLDQDIQTSINMASRNKIWLNGLNQRQVLGANISTASIYFPVKMKNMWLWGSYVFDLAVKGAIIRNSLFEFVTITSSANAQQIDMNSCEFIGGGVGSWGVSATKMSVKNSTIDGYDVVNTQPSKYGFFVNNIVKDIAYQVSHNGTSEGGVLVQGNVYQNLNSEFVGIGAFKSAVVFLNCVNLTVCDNNFEVVRPIDTIPSGLSSGQAVIFYGNSSSTYIANRLIVKNNIISLEDGSYNVYSYTSMGFTKFADYGHNAVVEDNIQYFSHAGSYKIPSTTSSVTSTQGTGVGTFNFNINIYDLCLPSTQYVTTVNHLISLVAGAYDNSTNTWVKVNPLLFLGGGNCYVFIESAVDMAVAGTLILYGEASVSSFGK